MLHLHIHASEEHCLQIWSPFRKESCTWIQIGTTSFIDTHARPYSPSAFVRIYVNNTLRGYTFVAFPDINPKDGYLQLHDVAINVRVWTQMKLLLDHASITWMMLRSPIKTRYMTVHASNWNGIGNRCSAHSIQDMDATIYTQDNSNVPKACIYTTPGSHVMLPTEQLFIYKGGSIATETWFTNQLRLALKYAVGVHSVSSLPIKSLLSVLSFMFLRDTMECKEKIPSYMPIVDAFMHYPSTDAEKICLAFHLASNLLFGSWATRELCFFQHRVMVEVGFPYVAMNKKHIKLIMIPYSQLGSLLGIAVPIYHNLQDIDVFVGPESEVSTLSFFESPVCEDIAQYSGLKPLRSRSHEKDPSFDRLFGNAHAMLFNTEDPFVSFVKQMNQTQLRAVVSVSRKAESDYANKFSGVITPLDEPACVDSVKVFVSPPISVFLWSDVKTDSQEFEALKKSMAENGLVMSCNDTNNGILIGVWKSTKRFLW